MISHYALYDIAALSTRFSLSEGLPKGVKPSYNISPTVLAPVVMSDNGKRVVKLMHWGLLAKGATNTNSVFRYKTYNTVSEAIFSRHSWELAVREKRCLIPANGFYVLNGSGKKRAYYAQPQDKSLVAFAGIYNEWQDAEGITHRSYSLITTEATADMPDPGSRMPVIIDREYEADWLNLEINDAGSIYKMLRPNPTGLVVAYEVSAAIHSPKPNAPSLIEPLAK